MWLECWLDYSRPLWRNIHYYWQESRMAYLEIGKYLAKFRKVWHLLTELGIMWIVGPGGNVFDVAVVTLQNLYMHSGIKPAPHCLLILNKPLDKRDQTIVEFPVFIAIDWRIILTWHFSLAAKFSFLLVLSPDFPRSLNSLLRQPSLSPITNNSVQPSVNVCGRLQTLTRPTKWDCLESPVLS